MVGKPQSRSLRSESPLAVSLTAPRHTRIARPARAADHAAAQSRPRLRWAAARVAFHAYVIFAMLSVVGGFLTAPLMTWYFYGDWRAWRHMASAWRLYLHGWKMAWLVLRRDEGSFMFSVPLASPPHSAPQPHVVRLTASWEYGSSCGPCSRCCEKIDCPVLDRQTGKCQGYDSFFWRYFNCGRFPTVQPEIDYYGCPKWELRPALQAHAPVAAREADPSPQASPATE